MARRLLNLGILAHVDAGKTTLTERLLHAAGAIDRIGSVDAGTTQTDTLALERQRGITIRAAVASFTVDDVTVNLIDTPGHPDFIAEVERVLRVLDGAVLVVSAVEGVQPQTRVLMAALRRLRVPTVLFVNKVDRSGADVRRVVRDLRRRLDVEAVALAEVSGQGRRDATVSACAAADQAFLTRLTDVLSLRDDALVRAFVERPERLDHGRLRAALRQQTRQCRVHPLFVGSAITGVGVPELMTGLVDLLARHPGDATGPVTGQIFKIERDAGGARVAYVRLFTGALTVRSAVPVGDVTHKVNGIKVFDRGAWVPSASVRAGEIAQLTGLSRARVGDRIGPSRDDLDRHFAPPTLETVVEPRRARDRGALRIALTQLAEQDPLINLRQGDLHNELTVTLYGEVQKEVIGATLAADFGLDVEFRESTVVCVERLRGPGEAVDRLHSETNPFNAWLGLRVEPRTPGAGLDLRLAIEPADAPLYIYRNMAGFAAAMAGFAAETLSEGLYGWAVPDVRITVTECVYSSADGPPSRRGPMSTAADFRRLTAVLLMRALDRAGTVVCEPVLSARLHVPAGAAAGVVATLVRLGARVRGQVTDDEDATIQAELPAARLRELRRQLPGLTGGEPQLETSFAHYAPTAGTPPTRPRVTPDPRNLDEYLAVVGR